MYSSALTLADTKTKICYNLLKNARVGLTFIDNNFWTVEDNSTFNQTGYYYFNRMVSPHISGEFHFKFNEMGRVNLQLFRSNYEIWLFCIGTTALGGNPVARFLSQQYWQNVKENLWTITRWSSENVKKMSFESQAMYMRDRECHQTVTRQSPDSQTHFSWCFCKNSNNSKKKRRWAVAQTLLVATKGADNGHLSVRNFDVAERMEGLTNFVRMGWNFHVSIELNRCMPSTGS